MSKSYGIEWKSHLNGRSGRGTKVFELEDAQRLADELNREFPGIHHQPVEIAPVRDKPPEPDLADDQEAAAEAPQVNHDLDPALSFE
jgi:hypothetical protein